MEYQIKTQTGKSVKVDIFMNEHTIYMPSKNYITRSELRYVRQQARKISPMSKLHWLNVAKRGIATWELHFNGERVAKILFSQRKGYNGKMDKMPIINSNYILLAQAEKLGWFNRNYPSYTN